MSTFAQVTDDTITTVTSRLPKAARRLDTGEWVLGLSDAPAQLREACGWFPWGTAEASWGGWTGTGSGEVV